MHRSPQVGSLPDCRGAATRRSVDTSSDDAMRNQNAQATGFDHRRNQRNQQGYCGASSSRRYDVVVTGANPDSIAEATRILSDDILVTRSDARSLSDIEGLIATVRERLGTLNLLFLNAGIGRIMPVETIDEDALMISSTSTSKASSSPCRRRSLSSAIVGRWPSPSAWG